MEVGDHTLTVSGKRAEEKETNGAALRYRERLESTFERRFQLPLEADPDHIVASYGKGVLTLHVPKVGDTKRKSIKIGRT